MTIDGKEVGTFRVAPEKSVTIERSVHQDGKFMFFRLGSSEAVATKVPTDGKAGMVTAQFIPESLIRVRQLASYTEYEVLPGVVFSCPDCKEDSKVPEGIGYIRIKCPHCTCQFVRKA